MKYTIEDRKEVELGTRRVRKVFLWTPLVLPENFRFRARSEFRWLCTASIQQQYREVCESSGEGMGGFYSWKEWVDECWIG